MKAEHANKISHVQTGYVRTGIGNTLGERIQRSASWKGVCGVCA